MVYDVLTRSPAPLHVSEILARALAVHGRQLDRESLVSSLTKCVARGDRFTRPAPNTFGLLTAARSEPGGAGAAG